MPSDNQKNQSQNKNQQQNLNRDQQARTVDKDQSRGEKIPGRQQEQDRSRQ